MLYQVGCEVNFGKEQTNKLNTKTNTTNQLHVTNFNYGIDSTPHLRQRTFRRHNHNVFRLFSNAYHAFGHYSQKFYTNVPCVSFTYGYAVWDVSDETKWCVNPCISKDCWS